MSVSLKCQYALRALFELAKRQESGLVTVADIASRQAIPPRFLENILNQLRGGGFVSSTRGTNGGYVLARPAKEIAVGEIIRFIEGPMHPVDCVGDKPAHKCPLKGNCVFMSLWDDARKALEAVYDSRTLQHLVDDEAKMTPAVAESYCI